MNKDDNYPSTNGDAPASPRTLLDRISNALLGEPTTAKELIEDLRDAERREVLGADALEMIEGVFHVSEMQVRDIMVPRAQMDVVNKNESPEEYLPRVIETAHSRFPMIDGDKDKVIGILLAKDLLRYFAEKARDKGANLDFDDFLRPAVFVPESKRLNILLKEFRSSRNHMAVVVDEYGGVAGLVTIEDVLEQIVGEIEDEHDIEEEDVTIMKQVDGSYTVKALTSVEDFNAFFKASFEEGSSDTVGGLVLSQLGHVPERGETIALNDMKFEVLRADSRRIHLLKVKPIAELAKQVSK